MSRLLSIGWIALTLCSPFPIQSADTPARPSSPRATGDLTIENRSPQFGEIGYRPADKSTAEFNPPSLTWLHEKPARTYTVQWARNPDFAQPTTISNLSFNCYTHAQPLKGGDYFWRYRFEAADARESAWSATRQFTVNSDSLVFPLPSLAQRHKLVPAGHPRLFVRPEQLPKIREVASGSERERFGQLVAEADKLLGQPLVAEPKEPGTASIKTNVTLLENWWKNRVQTLRACTEAETVAFVYLVTGEKKYGENARERILDLASWSPDGETNFRRNCEAAKPLLHRLARAYDWAYDTLSPAERAQVQRVVTRRIQDAWESGEVGRGAGHINSPLNSHGNRTFHKIGESGIVFLGEIPEADLWLDYALNKFYACYPVWSDADGGWHEGLSYWAGYMSKVTWWLQAANVALGVDGFKKPFFSHVGDYALYIAPPGSPNMGFGDLSGGRPSAGWGGFMEFFERNMADRPSNAAYWRWWSEQWKMQPETGVLGFLYHASLPALPPVRSVAELPASKVFNGIGVASLHTSLLDSKQDVHFLIKSSPFGSASHGHNAQNGFELTAFGDTLLPACVYRDWYGTRFHNEWVQQTISQNAVLVNGKGQLSHSGKAQGRIAKNELHQEWDYVLADATPAYDGRLTRALRHVAFVKPGLLVLCDELQAPKPAGFQFMLHALAPFELEPDSEGFGVKQAHSGLLGQYLGPEPLSLRQWDGFEPKPLKSGFANHWHLEAGTKSNRGDVAVLTVLAPYPGTSKPKLKTERLESATAVGVRATLNGRPMLVAFRKAGVEGIAIIGSTQFDSAVLVRTDEQ